MKKLFVTLMFLASVPLSAFLQPNYLGGNGTIISVENTWNTTKRLRKHEQHLQIGNALSFSGANPNIYSRPELEDRFIIGERTKVDFIDIEQVLDIVTGNDYSTWLKISTDNVAHGWILFSQGTGRSPYFNNNWEVLEIINVSNRNWTVRKLIQGVSVAGVVLNIRDKPGTVGTQVISQIIPQNGPYGLVIVNLDVIAATEESEIIGGRDDIWLKINYNGIEGWIFGGYTGVERGGAKYLTPENIISDRLGYW